MDWKLEVVVVPVSDVDRAKAFYAERVGFAVDVDHHVRDDYRFVQLTPPGSACSITIGTGITDAAPGSTRGLQLVVADVEAARARLLEGGVDVSEPFHFGPDGQAPGLDPDRAEFNSFLTFDDPDGNTWLVQEGRRPAAG